MKPARRIDPTDWMLADDTGALFDALSAGGGAVRFVGGCVRDAILGRGVSDLDVATDVEPQRVLEILEASGIRAVPTGIEHGTVTAIPGDRPFQVTTLRRDVETDGRRAVVRYSRDWAEDARRRDFTMNALSADREGNVYDYAGGLGDLAAGHVRFIGDAADRIREDHLRILRFFRFQANYGRTDPDPDALEACQAAVANLEALSGERIWQEFSRILAAPDPSAVLILMEKTHVLSYLLPVRRRLSAVRVLVALESSIRRPGDALRRLAALVSPLQREMSQIAARFRLSRDDTRRLMELNAERGNTSPGMPELAVRRSLYVLGPAFFGDLVLIDWADAIVANAGAAEAEALAWKGIWDAIADWSAPEFPLSGADVMSMGVPEGPEVGEIFREIEDWWVDQAFRPDREACLDRLRRSAFRRGYRP